MYFGFPVVNDILLYIIAFCCQKPPKYHINKKDIENLKGYVPIVYSPNYLKSLCGLENAGPVEFDVKKY